MIHLLLLLPLLGAPLAGAHQEDPETLRAAIQAAPALTEETRAALLAQVAASVADRQRVLELEGEITRFDALAVQAADEIARLQAELDEPLEMEPAPLAEGTGLAEFESAERQAQAELQQARAEVEELAREAEHRERRRREIPEALARLSAEERGLGAVEDPGPAADLPARIHAAAQASSLAALRAEHRALEAELRAYDAQKDLLPLRQQRWQRHVSRAAAHAEEWGTRLAAAREREAEAARRRALQLAREAAAQHPAVREVIEETQALITRIQVVGPLTQAAGRERESREHERDHLLRTSKSLRRKLSVAGLSDAMGRALRGQLERLESPRALALKSSLLRGTFAEAEIEYLDLQERVSSRNDEQQIGALLTRVTADGEVADPAALREVVEEAVPERNRQLSMLSDLAAERARDLEAALRAHLSLVALAEEHRRFVEERVLYVRSVEGGRLPQAREAAAALEWLVVEPAWSADLGRSWDAIGERPLWSLGLLFHALLFAALRGRLRRRVAASGEAVRRFRSDRLPLTFQAVGACVLLAAPVPLFLFWAGDALATPEGQSAAVAALGGALSTTAVVLFPLLLFGALMQPGGPCNAHFRWPTQASQALRRHLRWFLPLLAPLLVLALAFGGQESYQDSLGRPAAWAALAALAILLARVLRSRGEVLGRWLQRSDSLLARTHRVWFPAVVAFPVAMILVSFWGYHYTALQLSERFLLTIDLALGLVVVRGLLSRWRFTVRRRLAVEQARQRTQERAKVEAAAAEEGEAPPSPTVATFDEDAVDIPAADAQIRRLFDALVTVALAVGLYLVWAGALPALSALERVQVWPSFEVLETADLTAELEPMASPTTESSASVVPPGAAGEMLQEAVPAARGGPVSVSLADALLALILLGLTILLAGDVPGLLEFALLQRLPLDAGARYAVTTLVRYLILLIGITLSMGAVQIGWSTVQWLAAALTFGLAFGLQEIFANFVSGVILLLERPIRVGDWVTVDGVEGMVSRLRMRATTITDWDNRELLVPNKQFITGSLINWTLTDPVTRVVVPVGVAYGSDVREAERVLLQVAEATTGVLDEPAPNVVFLEFGDSALTLELRVYIGHRELWPRIVHEVHLAVDDAFREAGIEISFPQRDLHLRSVDAGAVERLRGK